MTAKALLLAASLLATASVAAAQVAPAVTPQPGASSPVETAAGARLRRLFHESDEANLRRNPITALFRGDFRYAAQLGDPISDAHFAAERAAAEQDLAALHAINRAQLNATDRLAYDVFEYQRGEDLADARPDMVALTAVRPLNHFSG